MFSIKTHSEPLIFAVEFYATEVAKKTSHIVVARIMQQLVLKEIKTEKCHASIRIGCTLRKRIAILGG